MMNPLNLIAQSSVDRLLQLDESMSLSNRAVALGWEYPLPGWAWLLIVIAALAIAHGSYARMQGPRWARAGLATFRAVLLVLIAVLLAGPTVVRTDITPDPDWLLVMVDRSASMNFEDTESGDGVIRREDALRLALAEQLEVFGQDRLGRGRNLVWFGYDREAYPMDAITDVGQLNDPSVQATNLRTAIDQALQTAAGRNVSGVVLFSDGQSPQPTGPAYVQRLARQDIPVFSVPLGSSIPRLDLAIDRVDAPVSAFAGDLVPLSVTIRRQDIVPGEEAGSAIDPAQVRVRLINADTDELLDESTLEEAGFGSPLLLQAEQEAAGELNLRVQVTYEGQTVDIKEEIALRNNSQTVSVVMVDRPIKVLYVEGSPRFEYHYLVTMLKREESIDSSVLLVDAELDFVQEGNSPISRFPLTAEELRPYDVIVIGDVHPRFFMQNQLAMIREHVATNRAGLLWIGGERHTPGRYAGTELELLLPMVDPSGVGRLVPSPTRDVPAAPTQVANDLNLLRLSLKRDREEGIEGSGWPSDLPPFQWAQDLGTLRPTAQILAHAVGRLDPDTGEAVEPAPLVVLYPIGGGEVIYVGTDEIWRWRQAGGEVYVEQFWIQLMRKLARTRVQQLDARAQFVVAPSAVDLGASQLVELIIEDPILINNAPPSVRVQVLAVGADEDELVPAGDLELRPAGFQGDAASGARAVYQANWRADRPGRYVLRVSEPLLESLELQTPAEVRDPAQELARAATDHGRLIALANGTGGAVIPLDSLAQLEGLVPDRSREITSETRQKLTNTLLALIVILSLLTLEWLLRRALRLV